MYNGNIVGPPIKNNNTSTANVQINSKFVKYFIHINCMIQYTWHKNRIWPPVQEAYVIKIIKTKCITSASRTYVRA